MTPLLLGLTGLALVLVLVLWRRTHRRLTEIRDRLTDIRDDLRH